MKANKQNKENKMQTWYHTKNKDHANRRNAGEEISLSNKLKSINDQRRSSERNIDSEIKHVIKKQRRLGHRTFSLPEEIDISPAPYTPLKKRIIRATKIDRISLDQRSVLSDQPFTKRHNHIAEETKNLRRYNTMEVLGSEPGNVMPEESPEVITNGHDGDNRLNGVDGRLNAVSTDT